MKIQKYKHDLPISYALGASLTWNLLDKAPETVTRIFVSPQAEDTDAMRTLLSRARELSIELVTGDKAFNILSPKGNCYVIGEFKKNAKKLTAGNHILLVNPSDAGNLGTITRTAVGFGFTDLAIISPAVDFFDPRTVRASMGAAFHLRVEYFDSIEAYRERFPENTLYAFMLTASRPLPEIEKTAPYSLVFGNEATGLPEEYASFCKSVIIKHSGNIDSLNLPMAAGIAMYEFTKHDWN